MKYLILMLAGLLPPSENHNTYVGRAVEAGLGTTLYAEEHEEFYESGRRVQLNTVYRDVRQSIIATREVDFSRNPFLPDFRLEDKRTGYLEGAELVSEGVRLFFRDDNDSPMKSRTVEIEGPSVVDAGFNSFIQAHWDSLMSGEMLYMNFLVPSRLESYGFRVYTDGETVVSGREARIVTCDIDNFLLRLFLDEITLTYDLEARRMVSYEGISNISDELGENYFVKITYQPYGP